MVRRKRGKGWRAVSFVVGLVMLATPILALRLRRDYSAWIEAFAPSSSKSRAVVSSSKSQLEMFQNLQFPPVINGKNSNRERPRIPYIIEQLGERPKKQMFDEISEVCIAVFFNEDGPSKGTPFKEFHLSYLRRLQSDDLRLRRLMRRPERANAMFVARRAVPLSSPSAPSNTPLILDMSSVYNLPVGTAVMDEEFVKGDVLGFCEITRKPYGLPGYEEQIDGTIVNGETPAMRKLTGRDRGIYPVLTNLAVAPEARNSGVGSKLLSACEDVIQKWDPPSSTLLLEVEDDNESALDWYQRRGYRTVFADPASRRYDANGWFLQKERCTKICMRKDLRSAAIERVNEQVAAGLGMLGSKIYQSLRDTVFQNKEAA